MITLKSVTLRPDAKVILGSFLSALCVSVVKA